MKEQQIGLPGGNRVSAIFYPAEEPRLRALFVLAHGAGAGQTSPFIRDFATALAARGVDVFTFNFPYMEARRRAPDRADILEQCFLAAIAEGAELADVGQRTFLGGKSMGGRIASHLAARASESPTPLSGLIVLGYPLHPPGKPEQLRSQHLGRITIPTLVIQGARDPFGTPDELKKWFSRPGMTTVFIKDGDHSFKVPKSSSPSQADVLAGIQDHIARWIAAH